MGHHHSWTSWPRSQSKNPRLIEGSATRFSRLPIQTCLASEFCYRSANGTSTENHRLARIVHKNTVSRSNHSTIVIMKMSLAIEPVRDSLLEAFQCVWWDFKMLLCNLFNLLVLPVNPCTHLHTGVMSFTYFGGPAPSKTFGTDDVQHLQISLQ